MRLMEKLFTTKSCNEFKVWIFCEYSKLTNKINFAYNQINLANTQTTRSQAFVTRSLIRARVHVTVRAKSRDRASAASNKDVPNNLVAEYRSE